MRRAGRVDASGCDRAELLEAVLHTGDRLPAPLKRAMAFARPEARGYCKAWNEFSGAKTEW